MSWVTLHAFAVLDQAVEHVEEGGQGASRPRAEGGLGARDSFLGGIGEELEGGVGGHAKLLGPHKEAVDGLLPDAPLGYVDDASEADGIVGVVDESEVGNDVLDLASLVETGAADQPVRDTVAHEGLFQDARLGVGAVHDGDVARSVFVVSLEAFDFAGDGLGLVLLVVGLGHGYGDAEAVVGPEALLLALPVAGNNVVGGVEDGLGGAVVLLQEDGPGAGESPFRS